MKKIKNDDLLNALNAIQKATFLFKDQDKLILEKEYDGYVSSLGASVINSGLLPTLSFYTDIHKDKNKVRRYKLLKVVFAVMNPTAANNAPNGLLKYVLEKVYGVSYDSYRAGAMPAIIPAALAEQKKRLLESAVAVKLAMRNFEHSDS